MKILLTNPVTRIALSDNRERYYVKAGSRWPWSYTKNVTDKCVPPFPFYLAYAAQILVERKFDVFVLDGVALNLSNEAYFKKVVALNPDLMVIETAMHAFRYDVDLAQKLKSMMPKTKIIMVGPTVTADSPQSSSNMLEDYAWIDLLIRGEYEFVLAEVVQRIQDGVNDLQIDGVVYRRSNNEIWASTVKGMISDINTLPHPAFELFPENEQPDINCYGDGIITYQPGVTLHSTRGCPFKCDFCYWNQVMYDQGKYRMFEPKRVVDEMEYVINKFGAREIYFDDDDFCVNNKHVLGICEEIKKRNLKIKWSCMGDAMASNEEMIKAMAEAGCIFMKFGVESGNIDVLKKIGKPLKPEKAIEISKLCRKYGIMTHATFVFGLYGDTEATMRDTLKLANQIKFDYAQASIATPFPGTRMYDKLVKEGAIEKIDINKFDGTQSCAFSTNKLSAEKVERFRKKAIRSMIFHKVMDLGWWRNYLKRNIILWQEHGLKAVLEPYKALLRL